MPFSNPIAAGNSLARPQFESPNFVPGVSGWAIFRNGNAQFNSLTLTGTTFDGNNYILNTSGFFLYSGAPANGNLSASIAPAAGTDGFGNSYFAGIVSYSGNRYSQLVGGDLLLGDTASTGSTAVVETSSTGGQTYIAGSTKTSADIAAPWLALFSAAGSAKGVVQAVIASGTTQPVALTTALAEIQGSLAVGATAAILDSPSGVLKVTDGRDGNTYGTERLTLNTTGTQLINSTVAATITGLSAPVAAATYKFRAVLWFLMGATTGAPTFSLAVPATSLVFVKTRQTRSITALGTVGGWVEAETVNNSLGGAYPVATTNATYSMMELEGIVTFSASGTFAVQAAMDLAAHPFTMQTGSFLELFPS